jgi:hypothetical protein
VSESSQPAVPPLVTAVEAALGTKVLSLRYLPSPTAAAAALGEVRGVPRPQESEGLRWPDQHGRRPPPV